MKTKKVKVTNRQKVVTTPRGKEYTKDKAFADYKTSSKWAILNAMRI